MSYGHSSLSFGGIIRTASDAREDILFITVKSSLKTLPDYDCCLAREGTLGAYPESMCPENLHHELETRTTSNSSCSTVDPTQSQADYSVMKDIILSTSEMLLSISNVLVI